MGIIVHPQKGLDVVFLVPQLILKRLFSFPSGAVGRGPCVRQHLRLVSGSAPPGSLGVQWPQNMSAPPSSPFAGDLPVT